jgi:hypothetical protein
MSSCSMADNGMVVSVRKVRQVSFCRQTYKVEASAQYTLDFLGWINSGTNGDNPLPAQVVAWMLQQGHYYRLNAGTSKLTDICRQRRSSRL